MGAVEVLAEVGRGDVGVDLRRHRGGVAQVGLDVADVHA
jgi:hypothetical protein